MPVIRQHSCEVATTDYDGVVGASFCSLLGNFNGLAGATGTCSSDEGEVN